MDITSKLHASGQSIFSKMSALAAKYAALNLSQGFPDFNCHPELIRLVDHYMKQGHNQYAPMPGVQILREAIAEKTYHTYGRHYHPDTEITVVPGATLGIYATISALVREGDEVIVIEPAYDCYVPAILLNGGKPVFSSLHPDGYRIKWDEIRKLINFKTRMIIINTPHNPCGSVLTEYDLEQLRNLLRNTDVLVLSDEVYEHIVFDGQQHLGMARDEELANRSIIVSSFGKTYHATGWKMGYLLAPDFLMKHIRQVYQYMAFSANTPVQYAYASFLKQPDHYLQLPAFYQQKRDTFRQYLQGSKWEVLPCEGSYFQLLRYQSITDENDVDFADRLVKEHGIAAIPVSVFYRMKTDEKVLRFCFAKGEDTLKRAAEILHTL